MTLRATKLDEEDNLHDGHVRCTVADLPPRHRATQHHELEDCSLHPLAGVHVGPFPTNSQRRPEYQQLEPQFTENGY